MLHSSSDNANFHAVTIAVVLMELGNPGHCQPQYVLFQRGTARQAAAQCLNRVSASSSAICWFRVVLHVRRVQPRTPSVASFGSEAPVYDAVAQGCLLPHKALICDRVRFEPSQGAPLRDPKNLFGPMTQRLRLALDGHDPAQYYQPPKTSTWHPFAVTVNDLQRRLGGRCCTLGLNHRLRRCPKDAG